MKETSRLPNSTHQAAVVLRSTTGTAAILAVLVFAPFLLRGSSPGQIFLPYQTFGTLLSLIVFMLTFEPHFADYWPIEAALFFSVALLISGAMAFAIENPVPLMVLIVAIPMLTVLLPWNWHFQLGISLLCVASAALARRNAPAAVRGHDLLWIPVAAESVIVVLAAVQLQRQRQRQQVYFEALAADEEQFRSLIENAPDGLTVVNRAGNIVFQSSSTKRLLGFDAEEMLHRSAFEFVDNAPRLRTLLDKCFEPSEHNESITIRCRHADGSWRIIEVAARQLSNYGSEALVVFNWRDVTERVTQEGQLRESEEKFRSIFQHSTNVISISHRSDARYIDVNDEWLRVFGYTRSEAIGKTPLLLGLWKDSDDYVHFATEFLTRGTIHNRETEFRAKDGSIVLGLLSVVTLETSGDQLALGIVNVLSKHRQLTLPMCKSTAED
jgi:PAS domain S-box-containing protein